eukprot:CAMPEP_0174314192 /NCGR_PEP_ID=MMETSP0810-20121108/5486_1 /TAXON_ID=73025 ORGANISM="Eutreptiella gymnastica-like, Strain CCMP1594" /NCGR_SAMPLE_ID=MMETSP0810 /ASSEMBLY_ACC=CAM_ASM_000659 /LENGTH=62 /DNA_ID=CAMNT_0015423223 /DNA_START=154 /DNA_END=342 /DNA_ORIENTATION=-
MSPEGSQSTCVREECSPRGAPYAPLWCTWRGLGTSYSHEDLRAQPGQGRALTSPINQWEAAP